jgi:hypothetical protein
MHLYVCRQATQTLFGLGWDPIDPAAIAHICQSVAAEAEQSIHDPSPRRCFQTRGLP